MIIRVKGFRKKKIKREIIKKECLHVADNNSTP